MEPVTTSEPAPASMSEVSSSPADPVVQLRGVSVSYEPGHPAVADIEFSVRHGEVLCLLGPSGCGKTTILRAIAGFERVESGAIVLSGRTVSSPQLLLPAEERHIGMVFQDYALFPHLRVEQNIEFGLRRLSRDRRRTIVTELLQLTGLSGLERRYPHELSGGQQQRVALARALAPRPVLLLLDEPFSNLDPDMASRMRQDLHELLRRTKTTTILVTHDHAEAFAMADRIAVLNHGRLEQCDVPETIYHLPSTPFVADFVGQADFLPGRIVNGLVSTEIGEFPNMQHLAENTNIQVMIRPDDIQIVPDKAGIGRILARQFKGSENLYTLQLQSGQLLHSSERSTDIYPIGTAVGFRLLASHTVLFQEAAPRAAQQENL